MKLDFKDHINEFGDNLVRLYNFDIKEAAEFKNALITEILENQKELEVDQLEFVEAKNCQLTLKLSDENIGIHSEDKKHFTCELTAQGYQDIVKYIEPFCIKESKAYRMLYDIDSLTDFVFSPSGT